MESLIKKIYKQFCLETKRNGGVLVHQSITEWHKYLAEKLEQLNLNKNESTNR